jgi:hypothetical protein
MNLLPLLPLILGALLGLAAPAVAQTGETAAVITEIKPARGRVDVKPAAGGDWRPARPLLALRAGDIVRTTENASAVVLLSGGRGTVRVEGAAGTLTVPGVAATGQGQKAKALVEASLGFLAGTTRESSQAVLATRSVARPPVILTERREVTGPRWEYPADAPALAPNARYTLQVTAGGQPTQEAWFEVVDAARARAVSSDLTALEQELGTGVPPTSKAVMRAGLLAREGLLHDARRVVVAALDADRDEPTLHLLLGDLYTRTGLADLAAESFDEAQFLLKK